MKYKGIIRSLIGLGVILGVILALSGCDSNKDEEILIRPLEGSENYTVYEVDACDLSGDRKPNAMVDVGFGDIEYWAYTNANGQLVKVIAEEIFLQDDKNEPVNENGRYCNDEANVPGTELKEYDQGHIIADSLKGVSSAYNIVPQDSYLNRHGDQAYMEDQIRKALKAGKSVTDFEAIISYPDDKTQIPNHFKYTYYINGMKVTDEFDNVNPESVPVVENITNETIHNNEERYILNINSKKIHKSNCESVEKISDKNKKEFTGDINELINNGYELCKICN